MTRDEVKKILTIMLITWPNYKPELTSEFVDVWKEMIGDMNYNVTQAALKAYAQSDTSGFAPSVGQLRAKAVELTSEEEMNEGEAWMLVRQAISNSIYGAEKEYAKLPKPVREAVGGYQVLRTWAMMEESDLDYARGSFMRNFNSVKAREKARLQLSDDLKAILDGRPKAELPKPEGKELPGPKTTEEERIKAAERAAERLKR